MRVNGRLPPSQSWSVPANRRKHRRLEVGCLLRRQDQGHSVFSALLGHGRNEAQPPRTVRLVHNDRVCDAIADSPLEHVLVEAVKEQRREGILEDIVLGSVNADHGWAVGIPQTSTFRPDLEEAIVVKLFETGQQVLQPNPRLWLRSHDFEESPEGRLAQRLGVGSPTPSEFLEALLDRGADLGTLKRSQVGIDGHEDVSDNPRRVDVS